MTTHSYILVWRIPWTEEPGRLSPWGRKESDKTERLTLSLFQGQSSSWHLAHVSCHQLCLLPTVQSPEHRERHIVHIASDFILNFCKLSETCFKSIPWTHPRHLLEWVLAAQAYLVMVVGSSLQMETQLEGKGKNDKAIPCVKEIAGGNLLYSIGSSAWRSVVT